MLLSKWESHWGASPEDQLHICISSQAQLHCPLPPDGVTGRTCGSYGTRWPHRVGGKVMVITAFYQLFVIEPGGYVWYVLLSVPTFLSYLSPLWSHSSLSRPFGSRLMTRSGVILNSLIDDFSWPDGATGQQINQVHNYQKRRPLKPVRVKVSTFVSALFVPQRNGTQPGKRPLTSLMPTIVLPASSEGGIYMALSSPGGPQGFSAITQVWPFWFPDVCFYCTKILTQHVSFSLSFRCWSLLCPTTKGAMTLPLKDSTLNCSQTDVVLTVSTVYIDVHDVTIAFYYKILHNFLSCPVCFSHHYLLPLFSLFLKKSLKALHEKSHLFQRVERKSDVRGIQRNNDIIKPIEIPQLSDGDL